MLERQGISYRIGAGLLLSGTCSASKPVDTAYHNYNRLEYCESIRDVIMCLAVARSNGLLQPMGAHRAIAVRLLNERLIWAYPIVGIPSAETLNDVATKAKKAERGEVPVLVYDYIGIRDSWMAHLAWLDAQIKAVKTIRVSEAGWALAGMDE
ncbi:hypothetical protein BN77_p2200007 [Rhizobium mesoamericanum STM3625]|uniref:Uncharacterized protein n=2 Tax=Rhizobium mesoamericanum TaxID=1079800 RepID=K0Q4V6_9HYPH|nr:hypothetical protein BN77_p2200007 [Rhizobium mesoamericanum STM3625]